MKSLKVFIPLAQLSLIFNVALLLSVVADLNWSHSRAAGGQYTHFPIGIRVIYLGMTFGMVFLIGLLWNHRKNPLNSGGVRLTRVLGFVFVLSSMMQLISRSANERLNVIPAGILAFTFFALSRRDEK